MVSNYRNNYKIVAVMECFCPIASYVCGVLVALMKILIENCDSLHVVVKKLSNIA